MSSVRRAFTVAAGSLLALVTWLSLTTTAEASAACSFSAVQAELQISGGRTKITTDGEKIVVWEARLVGRPPVSKEEFFPIECADAESPGSTATPTTGNTDTVTVDTPSLELSMLAPGRTLSDEGGSPEIEVHFSGTRLELEGSEGPDSVVFGFDAEAGGIGANLNVRAESGSNADTDIQAPALQELFYLGTGGSDRFSGAGAGPVEAGLPENVDLFAFMGSGRDVAIAGLGSSRLWGGGDWTDPDTEIDELYGGPSDDILNAGEGGGTFMGGAGTDWLSFSDFFDVQGGVSIDLRITGPQATGRGTVEFLEIEAIVGSRFGDSLIGDQAANRIHGAFGADTIKGLAGADMIDGDDDADDLYGGGGTDSIEGGSGSDRLSGGRGADFIDGSFGGDRLLGGAGPDFVVGGFGRDVLFGNQGADLLDAKEPPSYDFARDDRRIDCGPGKNSQERARRNGLDPRPRSC